MLNIVMYYSPPLFYHVNLQHSSCKHDLACIINRVENTVDSDQMAADEAS